MNARLFAVVLGVGLGGCAVDGTVDEPESGNDYQGEAIVRTIDRHNLLRDDEIFGRGDVTAAQVQSFLASKGSALATFREGSRTGAEIIVAESRAHGVSPVYMLARIQTESSLITSGSLSKINQATGCGCPDGSGCDPSLATFTIQIQCAARLMREYFKELDSSGVTRAGWRVGVAKNTLEGCSVTPRNRATAALYTYTPHAGAYAIGCGGPWGGSSLVAVNHQAFVAAFPKATTGACAYGAGLYCGGNAVTGDPLTLYRCDGGAVTTAAKCALGCERMPVGTDDRCSTATRCPYGDGLYCGGNGVGGDPKTLYRCAAGSLSLASACAKECRRMPVGQNDQCADSAAPALAVPTFSLVINGGLFTESSVRSKIEEGLRYEIERLAKFAPIKPVPHITITYHPASTSYCTGTAYSASTVINCPYGYPLSGDNQNYVVNITLHEIGHILAQHLIAPPSTRDNCVNEGLASWIAGKYWINSKSAPVDSFRTAARAAIDSGAVYASMSACHLASDNWYKLYASFFEYLEQTSPAALIAVSNGTTAKSTYATGWRTWLGR